jgi:hypothetical protein
MIALALSMLLSAPDLGSEADFAATLALNAEHGGCTVVRVLKCEEDDSRVALLACPGPMALVFILHPEQGWIPLQRMYVAEVKPTTGASL